jgi:hypothetical protein
LTADRQVNWNTLVHPVVVPRIVRSELIGPTRLSGFRIPREECRAPEVVAGTEIRVPDPGFEVA